jgi:hypothetical protein
MHTHGRNKSLIFSLEVKVSILLCFIQQVQRSVANLKTKVPTKYILSGHTHILQEKTAI